MHAIDGKMTFIFVFEQGHLRSRRAVCLCECIDEGLESIWIQSQQFVSQICKGLLVVLVVLICSSSSKYVKHEIKASPHECEQMKSWVLVWLCVHCLVVASFRISVIAAKKSIQVKWYINMKQKGSHPVSILKLIWHVFSIGNLI